MLKRIVFGQLRHLLTALGGSGLATGLFTESELSAAIGAAITLIGFAWSIYDKRTEVKK